MLWPLLLKLKSRDAEVRIKAVQLLADTESEHAFQVLTRTAEEDQDQGVRSAAITGIGQFPDETATTFLLRKFQDARPETRRAVVEGLRNRVGEDILAALVIALQDPDPVVRGRAAQVLDRQHWQPKDAGQALWHAIARGGFVEAVTAHGVQAIEPLQMILKTEDVPLQVKAIRALGEIDDLRTVDTLIPCLKSPERSVCVAAIEALSEFDSPKIIEPLVALLSHSDPKVCVAAIEAAARLNLRPVAQTITGMLQDRNWDVRSAAAVALGKIGSPQATESLVAVINDSDSSVRLAAIASLGRIADPAAIRPLVVALVDADNNVRNGATAALQCINPGWLQTDAARGALPELRAACASTDQAVRYVALQLVQQMGDSPTS